MAKKIRSGQVATIMATDGKGSDLCPIASRGPGDSRGPIFDKETGETFAEICEALKSPGPKE